MTEREREGERERDIDRDTKTEIADTKRERVMQRNKDRGET